MRFTKMHGLGNDYVYVDGFRETVDEPAALAPRIADRHTGVGGDGLILILPPDDKTAADVRMRIFNADGSEAQMCGNGIRCVAKYAHDHGLTDARPMRVQTGAGVMAIDYSVGADGKLAEATVDMGEPILEAGRIPVRIPDLDASQHVINHVFEASDRIPDRRMTCVSMGNPHAVFYCRDIEQVPLAAVGPAVETHEWFPERINAHFVQVHGRGEATMRTWERGSGMTQACGTGASAVCVAGVLTGHTDRTIRAHLPGGDLTLEWNSDDNRVYMTGPATEIFTGEWEG